MKNKSDSPLMRRYLKAYAEGKEIYLDADEVERLLDGLGEEEDAIIYQELLHQGLRLHPNSAELQARKVEWCLFYNEYEEALRWVEAISFGSGPELDRLRVECYCYNGLFQRAIELTERLIREECDYLENVLEALVPLLNDFEKYAAADPFIELGLQSFPQNDLFIEEKALRLEADGDLAGAIELLNGLIDKSPYDVDYWYSLARLYTASHQFDKAIEAFDFALTCDESDAEVYLLRGYCLYMNENYEKALESYREVETLMPDSRLHVLMMECYIKLEQFEAAYALTSELLPDGNIEKDALFYSNHIHCCLQTDRKQEADDTLVLITKLYPDDFSAIALLTLSYMESGYIREGLQMADDLYVRLKNNTHQYDGRYVRTTIPGLPLDAPDAEKTLNNYKKLLEKELPDSYFNSIPMALAYLAVGNIDIFLEYYDKIIQSQPQSLLPWPKAPLVGADTPQGEADNTTGSLLLATPKALVEDFLQNKDNSN